MIDVVLLPQFLDPEILPRSQVVVLDVLRATSTIVTALSSAAKEIRLAASPEEALAIRASLPPPVLVAGERGCVKIPGFDLGNSPAEYVVHKVGNATVVLTTTNGTRAAIVAENARHLFAGSLLNASATAAALIPHIDSFNTLLLCAGTDGRIAAEDLIGAGAILFQLLQQTYRTDLALTDTAWIAYHAFVAVQRRLPAALRLGQGGLNLIENGFEDDIDLCAALDTKPLVVNILKDPLRAVVDLGF